MIGRIIAGRYSVEGIVGRGGMAIVYKAYDKLKKQTVAIKTLRPEYETDEEFVRRFSREAEAASKVSHPNIVNMTDVGIEDGHRYIVMEYIDGTTLKELINKEGHIEPDKAIRMTIRILAAVDHAHKNGIVHRDIKPQNILVDKNEEIKVADFGIARLKTDQSTFIDANGKSALGSVHYFSPEQAKGEVADEKSDLYSVGVVLYEMLTGHVPFDGDTAISIAFKHVSEPPKSILEAQNGISKALDEVVMRSLAKDPAKRYQNAAEMAADLRKSLSHPRGGFVTYPKNEEELEKEKELQRKKRQKRARKIIRISATVGSLFLLLLIIAYGWYYFKIKDRVSMPNLVDTDEILAQDTLESIHLNAIVEGVYSDDVAEGYVISQSVSAGSRVRMGEDVTIMVSLGTEWYYLENYVGRTETETLEELDALGVAEVRVDYIRQSDAAPGTVLSQTLEEGWQSKNDSLSLTVSGQSVNIPTFIGLTLEGAEKLIESEGLVLGEVIDGGTTDMEGGTVIGQNIPAGTEVLAGTVINLTVSGSDATRYYPYSKFTIAVPLNELPVRVELETPSGSTVTAYSQTLDKGTHSIDLSSDEAGKHIVRVYMDDVLMESTELDFN